MPKPLSLLFCMSLILIATPASAAIYLSTPVLVPPTLPMNPGTAQSCNAVLTIVPNGPTTFQSNNELQITTGLLQPQWTAQVFVNGLPAATVPARGDALFVNGYLLSYAASSTVTMNIGVQGTVPSTPGSEVVLMNIVQLDNTGAVVPGTTITVTEPVSGSATPVASPQTPLPALTVSQPPVTKSPGFSGLSGTLAVAICSALLFVAFRSRKE